MALLVLAPALASAKPRPELKAIPAVERHDAPGEGFLPDADQPMQLKYVMNDRLDLIVGKAAKGAKLRRFDSPSRLAPAADGGGFRMGVKMRW